MKNMGSRNVPRDNCGGGECMAATYLGVDIP